MQTRTLKADSAEMFLFELDKSFGWYDLTITIEGNEHFSKRYAGHIETGKDSFTDPLMGGIV